MPPPRVFERVLGSVAMGPNGCIVSTLTLNEDGYARIGWGEGGRGGKIYRIGAHRAAWIATHGPIPDGLTVHHRCFNRRCVNVLHLELLTNSDNARRQGQARDLPDDGSCVRGHGPEHWVVVGRYRSGAEMHGCRECRRAFYRKWYAKNREARAAYMRAWYQRNRKGATN